MSDTATSIPQKPAREIVRASEETATLKTGTEEPSITSVGEILYSTVGTAALAPVIDIDRLWEAAPGSASQTVRALELLKQAIDYLSEAKKSENPMDSDRYVQNVQLTLPKLFACRSVGDGFGVIINSLHFAFANLHGTPLTPAQANVIWLILRELRTHPAMSLEQGTQHAEELEDCGLEVDPSGLGDLLVEGSESVE
jgi:hypothetical protein